MIGYLDWVQRVLIEVLKERPNYQMLSVESLAADLGIDLHGRPQEEHNEIIMALDNALRDLGPGLVKYGTGHAGISFPPEARRFRVEPLTSIWPALRGKYLEAEDEAFLQVLANLSEQPGEAWATVHLVDVENDVVPMLGWEWDRGDRAWRVYGHLTDYGYATGRAYGGPSIHARITYSGLVRALDATGALVREAEDLLRSHHVRAAGCIAAVELERRLKAIAPTPQVRKRDPELKDYAQTAFDAGRISQEDWTLVSRLAVIRKRCVHVLDRDPTAEEVLDLIDGVESFLRRNPDPG